MNSRSNLDLIKDRYKRRWLLLGIIWFFAIGLFLCNINKINNYYAKKEEILRMEKSRDFISRHMSELRQIMQERNKMYDHIPNIKIGLLELEEKLEQLASKNKLTISRIEHEGISKEENNLTILISCNGFLRGFIQMLSDLYKNYPFIRIKNININFTNKNEGKYRIRVVYNYIIDKN